MYNADDGVKKECELMESVKGQIEVIHVKLTKGGKCGGLSPYRALVIIMELTIT